MTTKPTEAKLGLRGGGEGEDVCCGVYVVPFFSPLSHLHLTHLSHLHLTRVDARIVLFMEGALD